MDLADFGSDRPPTGGAVHGALKEASITPSSSLPEAVGSLQQYARLGATEFLPIGRTAKKLPPGVYRIHETSQGIVYERMPILTDGLLRFPDSLAENVLAEIDSFWSKANAFKTYGYLHRRGYLLYGPAGSGKTCLVQLIVSDIVSRDGVVFVAGCCHPARLSNALTRFREVEAQRPIICLFEDIDATIREYGEQEILSILDGENQIDRTISLATTNFPELLPKRIVARPRRFDRIIKIGFPPTEHRRIYFEQKLKISADEVEAWVAVSDGWSFAACAELVIGVKCLGNPFDETVEKLNTLQAGKFSSGDFSQPAGFAHQ